MKEIALTRGKVALVDDEDYEYLAKWKWHVDNNGYARRNVRVCIGRQRAVIMHRELAGVTSSTVDVDHINRDKLDNRRCNLRPCTRRENALNVGKRKRATSRFKGVHWVKHVRKWQARITVHQATQNLGLFSHELDAARAYNKAAQKHFGRFAYLNGA